MKSFNVNAKFFSTRRFLLLCSIAALLTGCGQPAVNLDVTSAHYLNPNIYGQASPTVVTVYQLKSDFAFKQANYTALLANSGAVLGDDLIDKSSFEVRPGAHLTIKETLYPNTVYLGIVAAYRKPAVGGWSKIVKVKHGMHTATIKVSLETHQLMIDGD